jgi:hypothetical protein
MSIWRLNETFLHLGSNYRIIQAFHFRVEAEESPLLESCHQGMTGGDTAAWKRLSVYMFLILLPLWTEVF